jgi:hypothetical protein
MSAKLAPQKQKLHVYKELDDLYKGVELSLGAWKSFKDKNELILLFPAVTVLHL